MAFIKSEVQVKNATPKSAESNKMSHFIKNELQAESAISIQDKNYKTGSSPIHGWQNTVNSMGNTINKQNINNDIREAGDF